MPKTVKLASGKSAEVGSSTRVGKYTYTVQPDGAIKRSDGKITASATQQAPAKVAKPSATPSPAPRPQKAPVPAPRSARPSSTTPKAAATKQPVSGLRLPTVPSARPYTKGGNAGEKSAKPVQDKVMGMNTGIWRNPEAKITVQTSTPRKIDVGRQYGSNSTKKVDVAKMYGSRPTKK